MMATAVAWEIVRRAAGGDAGARQNLVESTLDDLWALALRLTRRRDDADDVVQETYSRVFATLAGLQPIGRFEGYLARIATNLVLERWRRRRPTSNVAEGVMTAESIEPWQAVADREDEQRRLAAIWEAIGDLDPQPRAALILYHAQGKSCDEVAEILDVPVGTVKTWLHRARNQVRHDAEAILTDEPAVGRTQTGDVS
jgi:RNA polymerase sigma-70 factor (ECF subfamily)